MLDRRISARLALSVRVQETNGDYLYNWEAADISEDGIFLLNKVCFSAQESFSRLTFTLPDGSHFHNITARIVRESRRGSRGGCALELMNLREDDRMALLRFLLERAAS